MLLHVRMPKFHEELSLCFNCDATENHAFNFLAAVGNKQLDVLNISDSCARESHAHVTSHGNWVYNASVPSISKLSKAWFLGWHRKFTAFTDYPIRSGKGLEYRVDLKFD
jgi:hypothetical protein